MKKIKKGDIVGRISYGKDILFVVDRIIKINDIEGIAILKGLTVRVKADSYLNDLELIDKRLVKENIRLIENSIEQRLKRYLSRSIKRERKFVKTGKILHLDGECSFVYIFKSLQIQGLKKYNL